MPRLYLLKFILILGLAVSFVSSTAIVSDKATAKSYKNGYSYKRYTSSYILINRSLLLSVAHEKGAVKSGCRVGVGSIVLEVVAIQWKKNILIFGAIKSALLGLAILG